MTYERYGSKGLAPARNAVGGAERLSKTIAEIRRFLEYHALRSYCDACLARRFDVTVEEVRTLTRTLSAGAGFVRRNRPCTACMQIAVTTSVGIRLRATY